MADFGDELEQLRAAIREAGWSVDPTTLKGYELGVMAGVALVGLVVGWTSGMGLISVPYAVVLVGLALGIRWGLIMLARGR